MNKRGSFPFFDPFPAYFASKIARRANIVGIKKTQNLMPTLKLLVKI
jgi:hypothetical protein